MAELRLKTISAFYVLHHLHVTSDQSKLRLQRSEASYIKVLVVPWCRRISAIRKAARKLDSPKIWRVPVRAVALVGIEHHGPTFR